MITNMPIYRDKNIYIMSNIYKFLYLNATQFYCFFTESEKDSLKEAFVEYVIVHK